MGDIGCICVRTDKRPWLRAFGNESLHAPSRLSSTNQANFLEAGSWPNFRWPIDSDLSLGGSNELARSLRGSANLCVLAAAVYHAEINLFSLMRLCTQ